MPFWHSLFKLLLSFDLSIREKSVKPSVSGGGSADRMVDGILNCGRNLMLKQVIKIENKLRDFTRM